MESEYLQFSCISCQGDVKFSPLNKATFEKGILCEHCQKKYEFSEKLMTQLTLFHELCAQIHRSQEILGQTSIAIDLEGKRLRLPYNLLLTRLSSVISLELEGKKSEMMFRIEPGKECPPPEQLLLSV